MKCNNDNQDKYKNISCPKCKCSNNLKKDGQRKTQNRGNIQRYRCKSCNYRFVEDDGFFRMRNKPEKITLCLDLFFRGVSTRKVQEHLQAFYPHNCHSTTILAWIQKYSKMIHTYTNSLPIRASQELQIDEMEYKTKGQKSWFIDTIDEQTRYMVSSGFYKSRDAESIKEVLRHAKKKTGEQIKICQTDGYGAYRKCLNKTFGLNKKLKTSKIIHIELNASKGEGFNCRIERLHNTIRERTKIFRGFKSIESANAIMKGYEVFYNFIRKHQSLGVTPATMAVPYLRLEGNNKWLELIKLTKN
jgi:transposase-like protein